MKQILFALGLCVCLIASPLHASPLSKARQQASASFDWPEQQLSAKDKKLVDETWIKPPLDMARFTYTFAEMKAKWPELMRGLKIDYPSPEYLKKRYLKFPRLLQSLRYSDNQWQQHSYNVLEVWQAFFRGDFQHASELGEKYGGYAQVPGVLSEIIEAVYLTPTLSQKQALLRDAILKIHHYGQAFPFVPGDREFHKDYAMMRLGFAYAVGRLAEDEPVVSQMLSKHPIIALNTVTELLAAMPNHPLGLALAGGIYANVIRRVGHTVGKLGLDVHAINAKKDFAKAVKEVPDMAIIRYEYANSMLYTKGHDAWPQAKQQLEKAVNMRPLDVMEALDIAYAKKHFQQLKGWAASDQSFRSYDADQRKMRHEKNINGYSLVGTKPQSAGAKQ